jgi:hypothetical protein
MRPRWSAAAALAALIVAGCSPGATPSPSASAGASPSSAIRYTVLPVPVSSELSVGPNRFLFTFIDANTSAPAVTPERTASVTGYPTAKGPSASVSGDGTFMWSIPDEIGMFRAPLDFSEAGEWMLEFTTATPAGPTETIPFTVDVKADPSALQVGDMAPSVPTPTLADVGGEVTRISTDTDPDPSFYETSLDEALAAGEPFVLAFATPAFCTSRTCGPMLDVVKAVRPDFPDVTFINVEPYELREVGGGLQPVVNDANQFVPVESARAFGILSEPWVFVIDGSGTIRSSLEGVTDDAELSEAIEAVSGS